jgi:hypothetical protein
MGRTALFDRAAASATLARQHGLITRLQASECAMSEAAVRHRLRDGGSWQVLLPGVYLAATGTPTGVQREMATLLYAGAGSLITGVTAMLAHGIHVPGTSQVDVLIPAERKRRDHSFVRVRRTSRMPGVSFPMNGLQYVPPARAVADAVRGLPDLGEVRTIVSSALTWRRIPILDLADELDSGPVVGSAGFRAVLVEAAEGIRSAAEAELRKLIKRSGLPDPLYNAQVYVGDQFIAKPDAWWHESGVAVEVDSREWHFAPSDWERTMARHARMSAVGMIVLHYPPTKLHTEPRLVASQIRSALAAGRGRQVPAFRVVPA